MKIEEEWERKQDYFLKKWCLRIQQQTATRLLHLQQGCTSFGFPIQVVLLNKNQNNFIKGKTILFLTTPLHCTTCISI